MKLHDRPCPKPQNYQRTTVTVHESYKKLELSWVPSQDRTAHRYHHLTKSDHSPAAIKGHHGVDSRVVSNPQQKKVFPKSFERVDLQP